MENVSLFKPCRKECDLCLPGLNYFETYLHERHALPDMKEYHDANVRITEQEEQTEKEVAESSQCKVPWLMRWMI